MKRLVVCCDGTWKKADDKYVSNIEKIARAIKIRDDADTLQLVHYSSGVGSGPIRTERFLGGAFGVGLDENLLAAYRFLALNYEPNDEIFVFGFSRGAYTARSLVGMVNYLGLLTPKGIAGLNANPTRSTCSGESTLREALKAYRRRPRESMPEVDRGTRYDGFRGFVCEEMPRIRFLGVFDTVGALGVPGLAGRKFRFHDVELGGLVDYARQALAIDERRRVFAPSVWTKVPSSGSDAAKRTGVEPMDPDVKQVWFDGVHSDVGGGYEEHALSDQPLAWMIAEAESAGKRDSSQPSAGLAVKREYLRTIAKPLNVHDSLSVWYRLLNAVGWATERFRSSSVVITRVFRGRRVLEMPNDRKVRVADTALRATDDNRRPRVLADNLQRWIDKVQVNGDIPEDRIEKIPTLNG